MKHRVNILLIIIAALFAMAAIAGCGEEQAANTNTQQKISCDPNVPSIIPATQGRPMLVYFFKDT